MWMVLSPLPVKAVVIEAVPYIGGGGITSFDATVINDQEVLLEWAVEPLTTSVMIRGKYSDVPMSMQEGHLIYEGPLLEFTDTSMNFDESLGKLYYRIWAKSGQGIWIDYEVNIAVVEGLMIGLLLLLLVVTFFAYKVLNSYFCKIMASMIWMVIGIMRVIEDQAIWSNVAIGVVLVAIGIYMLIMVGVDLIKGE